MRLIDADKIEYITEDEEKPSALDYVRRSHIADEPTVKAIPIEWLRNYYKQRYGGGIGFTQTMIEKMLQAWEKENENN